MNRTKWTLCFILVVCLAPQFPFAAADSPGCPDPASSPDVWKQALLQIDQYRSTYVLIYPDRLADKITSFGAPASPDIKIAAQAGSAADAARKHGITPSAEYPVLPDPGRIVQDLLSDSIQGAIVWAPMAGWLLSKWDTEHQLSMHAATEPGAPPSEIAQIAKTVDPSAVSTCSDQVRTLLEGYAVVPAESFKLDIFQVMAWTTPEDNADEAAQGAKIFQQYCASCHGQNAVKVSSLAPVNLLKTIKRCTYGGFAYVALHGRSIKGMPGYHGILDENQVRSLFQFVRARSNGRL